MPMTIGNALCKLTVHSAFWLGQALTTILYSGYVTIATWTPIHLYMPAMHKGSENVASFFMLPPWHLKEHCWQSMPLPVQVPDSDQISAPKGPKKTH